MVIRKAIMRLVKAEQIRANDPFGAYYDYLIAHREAPSVALELVRFSREIKNPAITPSLSSDASLPSHNKAQKKRRSTSAIPDLSSVLLESGGI